jgi:hypothetical protein
VSRFDKRSPAPWRHCEIEDAILDADGEFLFRSVQSSHPDDAMVAAAPEMLAALEAAVDWIDDWDVHSQVCDVIEKAKL